MAFTIVAAAHTGDDIYSLLNRDKFNTASTICDAIERVQTYSY